MPLCCVLVLVLALAQDQPIQRSAVEPGSIRCKAGATAGDFCGPPIVLFDGASLTGWTTVGGRYDGPARWTVEDGCLVGRTTADGGGGLIYTDRHFHSFDLELEVKMDHPFDSGVFLRMLPRSTDKKGLQVTLDHRPGGEIGGVYADGFLQHNPDGAAHYRQGEWNRVRVRSVGRTPFVQAWVNGQQVTDFHLPADRTDFAESGRIGLQVHGGEPSRSAVRFRAITLRLLPVFEKDQFELAGDGALRPRGDDWQDLLADVVEAWEPYPADAPRPRLGPGRILSLRPHGSGYQLRSKDDFADFELRLDFALAPGADSGVFLRARRSDDDPEVSGCEVQIADDHVGHRDMKRPPWALTGTLLGGIAPAVADALGPPGSWNTLEIRCAGRTIRTRLNGFTLYEVDTTSLKPSQGPPFSARAEAGFVGLQGPGEGEGAGDAAAVSLRNVFVRRVPR